ncbi:hypothetical protein [methane-oxidizing endosymbiont of Gigantopelta aegis]|uniref:hypothetical protein n=1 Tax=methane-oxidizing endosymbiont of Gigantopelta aegis TaxID=2794938 RepID=UPI0018DDCE15|nr:hypothetical protein [methane-oxidizing endosymbiont of Gigantopelta aegis]
MNYFSLFLLLFISFSGHARDSLPAVLKRMHTDSAVKLAYQERKDLALMAQPWHGEGFLYSLPKAGVMIKQQLKPEPILMAVIGQQLFYYDIKNQVHHQGLLDDSNPFSLNIAVFKALMSQDMLLLERFYQLDFLSLTNRWQLILKDKNDPDSAFKIIISGPLQQPADHIDIQQADGDSSTMSLSKIAEGKGVEQEIEQLLRQLTQSIR